MSPCCTADRLLNYLRQGRATAQSAPSPQECAVSGMQRLRESRATVGLSALPSQKQVSEVIHDAPVLRTSFSASAFAPAPSNRSTHI